MNEWDKYAIFSANDRINHPDWALIAENLTVGFLKEYYGWYSSQKGI